MIDHLMLDMSSDVPLYQQIVDRIEQAILRGSLKEGDFLPSVRELSLKHRINPNTISKAYQILQGLGLAQSVRGLGLKIPPINLEVSDQRKKEILISNIDSLIEAAKSLRIAQEDLLEEINNRLKFYGNKGDI
ncbi:MAG: GntR family transcriptional regulator [Bdellovibrionia bacterium]